MEFHKLELRKKTRNYEGIDIFGLVYIVLPLSINFAEN